MENFTTEIALVVIFVIGCIAVTNMKNKHKSKHRGDTTVHIHKGIDDSQKAVIVEKNTFKSSKKHA